MAEVTSGDLTVIALQAEESHALVTLLQDWVDDSFTRGYDCGDPDVIASYKWTVQTLSELFDAFGVQVEE